MKSLDQVMMSLDQARSAMRSVYLKKRSWWLMESLPDAPKQDQWPLTLALSPPSANLIAKNLGKFDFWREEWRSFGQGVKWEERKLSLGPYKMPASVSFSSPPEVCDFLGEGEIWRRVFSRFLELSGERRALALPLAKSWQDLAEMSEADFKILSKAVDWLAKHPDSKLYVRQLPITGADSKWLEKRKTLILKLMRPVLGFGDGVGDLVEAFGLSPLPNFVKIRILDPQDRSWALGLDHLSAPIEEAAKLPLRPERVFIVENYQTGLAFGDLPGSVLFYGHGRNLAFLAEIPWIRKAKSYYWGDLDTHGLAMLSQARGHLPGLESVLMDRRTLMDHKDYWVAEPKPFTGQAEHLTDEERRLLEYLGRAKEGQGVRLEQELIRWDRAWRVIERLAQA
jgi:hypothetical protein